MSLHKEINLETEICSHLGAHGWLDAEARRAIDLPQERRTALISAAVTGQIDVRGVAAGQGTKNQEPRTKDQGPETADEELRMVAEDPAPDGV